MQREGQLQVIKYNIIHLKDILELWKEAYDNEYIVNREILFKWITEQSPFARDEFQYLLLLLEDKVIGMLGHMPLDISVYGEIKRGYISHDILLAKEHQGKGLGKVFLKGLEKQAPRFAGAIWFNEPNYYLYQKCGWLDVKGLYPYLRIFDPEVFLKAKISNRTLLRFSARVLKSILFLKAIPGIVSNALYSKDIQISELDEYKDDIEIFNKSVLKYYGIIVSRNKNYLNWKFVKKPFNNYKRYVAYYKGELSGYAVIKTEQSGTGIRGKVLDILVHPMKTNVFQSLIHKSLEYFSNIGVSHVEILCTFPPFIKELKKNGFIKSNKQQPFMVKNWEGEFDMKFVSDIRNWYLTYSEADGDAWAVNMPAKKKRSFDDEPNVQK
jgi:GNAT superfamily N-acetyltransferase